MNHGIILAMIIALIALLMLWRWVVLFKKGMNKKGKD